MNHNFRSNAALDTLKSQIEFYINSKSIFVLSKVKCGACVKAKALLNKLSFKTGIKPSILDLDNYPKQFVRAIISWLSAKTGIKTVPQIFIKGKFVGGNDDVQKLHTNGRLLPLIGMQTGTGDVTGAGSREVYLAQHQRFPGPGGKDSSHVRNISETSNSSSSWYSGSPMSYSAASFLVDEEKKWETFPQFSQSSRSFMKDVRPLRRSKSLEVVGIEGSSSSIGGSGKYWHPSSSGLSLPSLPVDYDQRSASFDVGFPQNWIGMQPNAGSSSRRALQQIVISRYL